MSDIWAANGSHHDGIKRECRVNRRQFPLLWTLATRRVTDAFKIRHWYPAEGYWEGFKSGVSQKTCLCIGILQPAENGPDKSIWRGILSSVPFAKPSGLHIACCKICKNTASMGLKNILPLRGLLLKKQERTFHACLCRFAGNSKH